MLIRMSSTRVMEGVAEFRLGDRMVAVLLIQSYGLLRFKPMCSVICDLLLSQSQRGTPQTHEKFTI
jgi:hypothetical protein